MRCFPKLLLWSGLLLLAPVAVIAQGPIYAGIGRAPTPDEVRALDIWLTADGKGLPPGSGTAAEGAPLFLQKCAGCHGRNGEGAPGNPIDKVRLVGGVDTLEEAHPIKTIASFWPNGMVVFDFINRAMPPTNSQSLKPAEVYSILAFLLAKNGLIKETDVLDATSLAKLEFPNRNGFIPASPQYPHPAEDSGDCGSHSCTKAVR